MLLVGGGGPEQPGRLPLVEFGGGRRIINAFNAAMPANIATLQGEGIACTLVETNTGTGQDTGLHNSDNLHPNRAGAQLVAQAIYDALVALDIDDDMAAGNAVLWPIGDSITAGGMGHVVGQYRPYLAQLLWEAWNE